MKNDYTEFTWEQLKSTEKGTILHDEEKQGVRFVIRRGLLSLCAYVGCLIDYPLANKHYDEIPLSVHGGLTFSCEGNGVYLPKGFYWYGWDYGHAGDKTFQDDMIIFNKNGKEWCVNDVIFDSCSAIYDFATLMKLAEKIKFESIYSITKKYGA
jgi:hypothetical protein